MSDLRRLNSRTVAIVLSIALVVVVLNALTTGAYTIKFGEVFKVLFEGPTANSDTSVSHAVFWNALIGLAVFIADDDQIRTVTFWSLGSLGLATWRAVALVLPLAIIGIALSTKFARTLDLMALGDRSAAHVGVPVERVRLQTIAIVGLLASSAVAATGIIAFVGLIVPHILRLVVGPKHRDLLWSSALLGAIVTLLADLAARTLLSPAELPLGVLTALIGAPFFLWLLRKMRTSESTWS
ncbi:MAG: iron ABC transporter permease [Actinobacteria bacterium]|nr:iron ABC transporter permease [Actinomycetota bacterium]